MESGAARPAPERALADLLGLAARARAVVHGTGATRQGVRDGEIAGVLLAADSSPTQTKKLVPLLEARGVPYAACLTRAVIGASMGQGPVSALGIKDRNFARRALELAAALQGPEGSSDS
ncbi:MAG: L7Ae/L30e/S12e/Gadd45 family ribosomal protein [Longimicrobiaceae bacterium]